MPATSDTFRAELLGLITAAARRFGDQWLTETRSAILLVPSVVARLEWNALVNPAHSGASRITLTKAERVVWDRRLFSGG